MHEIICPHCNKAFKIDEAGYADILKQVRDSDFDKQLHERLELAEREKRDAIALAEAKVANELQKTAAVKDTEIQALKAQLDAGEVANKLALAEALGTVEKQRDTIAHELAQAKLDQQAALKLAEAQLAHELQVAATRKEAEIQALQAQLDAAEVVRKLAVTEALGAVSKERDQLANELEQVRNAQQAAAQLAEAKLAHELQAAAAKKDAEIQALQAKLEASDAARQLAVNEAVGVVARERDGLKNDLSLITVKNQLEEKAIKEKYELQIKERDGAIESCGTLRRGYRPRWSVKPWSSTARSSSTASVLQPFSGRILKKTTTPAPAARATTFFASRMRTAPRSSPSCSR